MISNSEAERSNGARGLDDSVPVEEKQRHDCYKIQRDPDLETLTGVDNPSLHDDSKPRQGCCLDAEGGKSWRRLREVQRSIGLISPDLRTTTQPNTPPRRCAFLKS